MEVDVRQVTQDERAAWNAVLDTAFLRRVRDQATDEAYWSRHPAPPQQLSQQLAAFVGRRLVGTALVFSTALSLPGGGDLGVEALSGVGVLPTHRRRGVLNQLMSTTLGGAAERSAPASILIAAEYPIYGRFGYGPASESTAWEVTVPTRFRGAAPGGTIELTEPSELRKLGPDLFTELRRHRPGNITRDDLDWDEVTGLDPMPWRTATPRTFALWRAPDGRPAGYVAYHPDGRFDGRRPDGVLQVDDLVAVNAEASTGLWRFLCEVDWVRTVRAGDRPTDELVPYLLVDGRQARQVARHDFLWLRVLDPVALLGARHYLAERRLVIEVVDGAGFANGRFELDGGRCRRSRRAADLTVPVEALGAIALGGAPVRALADAGWLQEERAGALDDAAALFHWPVAPWCATWF